MNKSKISVPKIHINAEHQRLMWLNFSPSLIFGISLLFLFFIFLTYKNDAFYTQLFFIGTIGLVIFIPTLLILIRRSIQNDIQSQLWDQLRMSSLSSWQMTWTRIFTAPILAWFGISISSALIFISLLSSEISKSLFFPGTSYASIINPIIILIGILLLCWVLAGIFLINVLQFNRSQSEWNGSYLQNLLLWLLLSIYMGHHTHALFKLFSHHSSLFSSYPSIKYGIGLLLILAIYIGLGVWRSMSYKLHLKSSQHYWLFSTLLLPFIFAIYYYFWQGQNALLFIMSSIYAIVSLISISTQDNRRSTLERGMAEISNGQILKGLSILPIWTSLLVAYFLVLMIILVSQPVSFINIISLLTYILIYCAVQLISVTISRKYNSVSISLISFLILYWFFSLFTAIA